MIYLEVFFITQEIPVDIQYNKKPFGGGRSLARIVFCRLCDHARRGSFANETLYCGQKIKR